MMIKPNHIPKPAIIIVSVIMCGALFASSKGRVTTRTMLDASGSKYTETVTIHDGLGRCVQTVQRGVNTTGVPVVTATELNSDGTARKEWLPFAAPGVTGRMTDADIQSCSRTCHSDPHAYSELTYDAFGREVFASTPGDAWHQASKGVSTAYSTNSANSVRRYIADASGSGISLKGYWGTATLKSVRTTDEDGVSVETFSDLSGRTVLERRGGDHDTYFVYNKAGQLRFVLQPMFQEDASLEKYTFEYRYDGYGNVVYKGIPGGGYTQYWYDTGRRMTFMQDPNLRSRGLHRFYVYDGVGRLAIQGVSASCTVSNAVNKAEYTGGASGFRSTGYTIESPSRLQQTTLEIVNYYDGYDFVYAYDTRLVQASASSAKGRGTGTVTYDSSEGYSVSATYYDVLGNITSVREITDFGTLQVTDCTYTFTGQPLTTKVTETDGPTVLTQNNYDASSGLLKQTDVTVNGAKASVARYAYDDLGRMTAITRGGYGGKVTQTYDLHGKTKTISGPGMTQKLYYADGPGTKLYNGSVSSMTWTIGTDPTVRGYKYSYNGYGWLTSADYGEGTSLSGNRDRYSEKSLAFTKNGSVTRLQRYGLMASGAYGKTDDLTITYSGNQISSVTDAAPAVTQTGSMDYAGGSVSKAFAFNSFGALTKDESRKISSISYDTYGYPSKITYTNGNRTQHVYSATGTRLATSHSTEMADGVVTAGLEDTGSYEPDGSIDPFAEATEDADGLVPVSGFESIEYHGNTIWRNGKVDMVLFPGGYATLSNGNAAGTPTFHYYTSDYLGNVRAVVNGSTGTLEQAVSYYPYGGIIPNLSSNTSAQPYKYGGKELTTANGLNEYDFGARQYWQAVPGFTSIDPCAGDYTWLSPYLYCGNNPVNAVDKDGRKWTISLEKDDNDKLMIHMKITGVVYRAVSTNVDLQKLANSIKDQLESVYSFSTDNYSVDMTANIRVATNEKSINETDHVFALVSEKNIKKNSENAIASADSGGLLVKLSSSTASATISKTNTRTIAHEVGHTGGLNHVDENTKGFDTNLMTQIKNLPEGTDKNKAVQIKTKQLSTIVNNYYNEQLNKRSPKCLIKANMLDP